MADVFLIWWLGLFSIFEGEILTVVLKLLPVFAVNFTFNSKFISKQRSLPPTPFLPKLFILLSVFFFSPFISRFCLVRLLLFVKMWKFLILFSSQLHTQQTHVNKPNRAIDTFSRMRFGWVKGSNWRRNFFFFSRLCLTIWKIYQVVGAVFLMLRSSFLSEALESSWTFDVATERLLLKTRRTLECSSLLYAFHMTTIKLFGFLWEFFFTQGFTSEYFMKIVLKTSQIMMSYNRTPAWYDKFIMNLRTLKRHVKLFCGFNLLQTFLID